MSNVYIVIEGGCVRYVSSENDRIRIHVLDLDDRADPDYQDKAEFDAALEQAEKLTRVW